jgi:Ca2+-dependent lipid-binding protein
MDPYILIENHGVSFRTKVKDGGGKNPTWNETFQIPVKSMGESIKVTCLDEDIMSDDMIGSTVIPMSTLCSA